MHGIITDVRRDKRGKVIVTMIIAEVGIGWGTLDNPNPELLLKYKDRIIGTKITLISDGEGGHNVLLDEVLNIPEE
jgi:hypothetical protein